MHRFIQRGRSKTKTDKLTSKKKRNGTKLFAIGALVPPMTTERRHSDDVNNNTKNENDATVKIVVKNTLYEGMETAKKHTSRNDDYAMASQIYDEVPSEDPYEVAEIKQPPASESIYEETPMMFQPGKLKPPEPPTDGGIYCHLTPSTLKTATPSYDTLQRDLSPLPSEAIYESCSPTFNKSAGSEFTNPGSDVHQPFVNKKATTTPIYDDVDMSHDEPMASHKQSANDDIITDRNTTPVKIAVDSDVTTKRPSRGLVSPRIVVKAPKEEVSVQDKGSNLTIAEAMDIFKNGGTPKKERPQLRDSFRKRSQVIRRESGRVTKLRTQTARPTADGKHVLNDRIDRYNAGPRSTLSIQKTELATTSKPTTPRSPKVSPLNVRRNNPGMSALPKSPPSPTQMSNSELARSPLFKTMQQKFNQLG